MTKVCDPIINKKKPKPKEDPPPVPEDKEKAAEGENKSTPETGGEQDKDTAAPANQQEGVDQAKEDMDLD